jgi:hypothetical protein
MSFAAVVVGAAVAFTVVASPSARRLVRAGGAALVRIEKKHHVFSGAIAVLLALAGLAAVGGLLLMWALRTYMNLLFG